MLDLSSLNFQTGALLLVDKPQGYTSFDVVNKLRYRLRKLTGVKKIKVGHSGTLDPMATGLLLIATGKFTKQLTELTGLPKQYTGTIRFGESTPSYDAETEVDQHAPTGHITSAMLQSVIAKQFLGAIEQQPPVYSAIKVDGQRAYKSARAGKAVELPSREVLVSRFDITGYVEPEAEFVVDCSKGTYIRSLAHDLGVAVDSRAHLVALRRTLIGKYSIDDANTLDEFTQSLDQLLEQAGHERPSY